MAHVFDITRPDVYSTIKAKKNLISSIDVNTEKEIIALGTYNK